MGLSCLFPLTSLRFAQDESHPMCLLFISKLGLFGDGKGKGVVGPIRGQRQRAGLALLPS